MTSSSDSAWDGQWLFLLHRFLIAPSKTGIPTTDADGRKRTVAALAVSRVVLKYRGHARSVHPGRALSLAGFGLDASNWQRARSFSRAEGKAFLLDETADDGLAADEDRLRRGLEADNALGSGSDKAPWMRLMEL